MLLNMVQVRIDNNNNIIISIFKGNNVFSMIVNLPYGPPMNTDNDYYQTFLVDLFN